MYLVLSTYSLVCVLSLNSKRCIISMCSTRPNQRERQWESESVALRSSWMNYSFVWSGVVYSLFMQIWFSKQSKNFHLYEASYCKYKKKFIKYFKQQPIVLSLFCSVVRISVPSQSERSFNLTVTALFVLKPYISHALCEIFKMFF